MLSNNNFINKPTIRKAPSIFKWIDKVLISFKNSTATQVGTWLVVNTDLVQISKIN